MGGEVEDGSYLFARKSVEHLGDLAVGEAVFQILQRPLRAPCAFPGKPTRH